MSVSGATALAFEAVSEVVQSISDSVMIGPMVDNENNGVVPADVTETVAG